MEGVKVATVIKKTKKKKVKHDFDRIKQAEKKKRRLEKALATSAAICSELEKKKLKKKEQERLNEEGAAIAEAVALHVLVGEDTEDDSCNIMVKDGSASGSLSSSNIGSVTRGHRPFVPCPNQQMYLHENLLWSSDPYTSMVSSHPFDRYFCHQYMVKEEDWGSLSLSDDHLVAQAISSLQIADDASIGAYAFDQFLG